jgi:hypothetical protein
VVNVSSGQLVITQSMLPSVATTLNNCTLKGCAGYLLIRLDLSDKRGLLSCCFIAHNILGAA